MRDWRAAKSIDTFRKQLNKIAPNRDKVSDGIVGDTSHKARKSSHNPDEHGAVRAMDVTHNPTKGIDGNKLLKTLLASKDKRIWYIIFNGKIYNKKHNFAPAPYTGVNAHKHHLHLSVSDDPTLYDDASPWNLEGLSPQKINQAGQTSGESDGSGTTDKTSPEQNTANTQPAPEQGTEQTLAQSPEGSASVVKSLNEQDVTTPAQVPEPEPQGIAAKLKAGVGTLFGSAILYTAAEKFGAMSFSTQAIILFAVVAVIGLIGFMFWAWLDAWKTAKKTELTALANTDKNRRDIEWVKQ